MTTASLTHQNPASSLAPHPTAGQSDPSSSAPSTSFRSDVALPTALNLGKIGTSATTASTAAAAATNSRLTASTEYLDSLEESVNKTIDAEVETLLSSYKELVSLATVSFPNVITEAYI